MRLKTESPASPLRTQRTIEAAKARKHLWFVVALFVLCAVSFAGAFYGAKKLVVVSELKFSGMQHLKQGDLQKLIRLRAGDELFGLPSSEIRNAADEVAVGEGCGDPQGTDRTGSHLDS